MIFEMVLPDFLIRSLIMPSLKAQLFLVKKLSWNNCGVILHEFNIIRGEGNPGQALKPWTSRAKEDISNIF